MSAYVCSDDTFHYVLTAAVGWRVEVYIPKDCNLTMSLNAQTFGLRGNRFHIAENPTEIGQILKKTNILSVQHRYKDKDLNKLPGPIGMVEGYNWKRISESLINPVAVVKSCHCIDYQSCELPDWNKTLAKRVLTAIERKAVELAPGYDDAPWGWER